MSLVVVSATVGISMWHVHHSRRARDIEALYEDCTDTHEVFIQDEPGHCCPVYHKSQTTKEKQMFIDDWEKLQNAHLPAIDT